MKRWILLLVVFGLIAAQTFGQTVPRVVSPTSISNGGGSVSVTSGGAINATTASGQPMSVYSGTTAINGVQEFSIPGTTPSVSGSSLLDNYFDGTGWKFSLSGSAWAYGVVPGQMGFLNTANVWTAKQTTRLTTNQAEWGYDASNYLRLTVDSSGNATFAATGTNPNITLTPSGTGYLNLTSWARIDTTNKRLEFNITGGNGSLYDSLNGVEIVGAGGSSTPQIYLNNTAKITWSSGTNRAVFPDIGFARNAAGVVEINNGTAGTYRDLKLRQYYIDPTLTTSGTTGNVTINKAAGSVRFAASASTSTALVLTDSLIGANSLVYPFVRGNDATARTAHAVPSAGAANIYIDQSPTAETEVGFIVINQ